MTQGKEVMLFYTDCHFVAGSEFMAVNMASSQIYRDSFNPIFSFRNTKRYRREIEANFGDVLSCLPVSTLDPNSFSRATAESSSKLVRVFGVVTSAIAKLPFSVFNATQLAVLLKTVKPKVLHINNGGFPGAQSCRVAAVVAKLLRVPVISMTVNNTAIDYKSPSRWPDYIIDSFVRTSVQMFVTGSKSAALQLQSVLNLEADKVASIHNGVRIPQANNPQSTRHDRRQDRVVIFGVVANHEKRKGHDFLLRALATQKAQDFYFNRRAQILIEGDGPELENNKRLATELGLSPFVTFLGRVADVHGFMSEIDVLLLPSVSGEDLPNVISEAMGHSKAVIASNMAGIPEQVLHTQSGFLFEVGDDIGLLEGMREYLDHPELIEKHGYAGRLRFEDLFRPEMSVGQYFLLHQKLLEESTHANA